MQREGFDALFFKEEKTERGLNLSCQISWRKVAKAQKSTNCLVGRKIRID